MLWELDGCRGGPVCHGEIAGAGLLYHAANVIQDQFLSRSESFNFNLMALVGGCAPPLVHCMECCLTILAGALCSTKTLRETQLAALRCNGQTPASAQSC